MTSADTPARPDRLEQSLVHRAAVLLVLVQCVTLAHLVQSHGFAFTCGGLACLSLSERMRMDHRRAPHWLWFALLAILLALKYRVAPESLNEQVTFFNTAAAYEAARFLVFVQVVQLYFRRPGGRLPSWFAVLSVLGMVFSSNVRLNPSTRPAAVLLCMAFVAALALFAALHRRRATPVGSRAARWCAGIVLALALGGGLATAGMLRKYESRLERWLIGERGGEPDGNVASGFSGRGALGEIAAWKEHASEHISLRVYSDALPGYLRGNVFDDLQDRTWTETAQVRAIEPVQPRRLSVFYPERLYPLREQSSESNVRVTLEIWPDELTGERVFLPLEAAYLATPLARVTTNRNDLAARSGVDGETPFTVWLEFDPPRRTLDAGDRRRYLQLDELQRSELERLARDIFADCRDTREKLSAVAAYFRDNFEYQLQPQQFRGSDPIVHFLQTRHAAHCEYFASAGALLLRAADVPTRYVTGYVASEQNAEWGYWIARRRDAHAWIEAFDAEAGVWRTVECTPAAGVPSSDAETTRQDWWDARWQLLRKWAYRASAGGVRGWLLAVGSLLMTPPGLVLLLLGGAAAFLWKRRYDQQHRPIESAITFPALHRTLRRADRLAGRFGLRRDHHETLTGFAARLRRIGETPSAGASALADWYDAYVRIRYGAEDATRSATELAALLRTIASVARGRGRIESSTR